MNIGIVTSWFERGAAYVSRQYRQVLETEHSIHIFARGGETRAIGNPIWDVPRVTWSKVSGNPLSQGLDLEQFKRWINNNRLELIFFNEQRWWAPVILANRLGIKTGAYVDYYTENTVPLFGCYDFLVCNTLRHWSVFNWHPSSYYIPWGTDLSLFKPYSTNPVNPEFVTFFHSAGYSPARKGTDLVLQAFRKLKGTSRLVVHSQNSLQEDLPESASLIRELEQTGVLSIHERTVPAPGLYHLGDVYVYPSRIDGLGLTIAEALACGLPAIVSDNPPMNEFIGSDNGRLANISRLYSRSDGYYWPQCEVDVDHLATCMQAYVDDIENLPTSKHSARKSAEANMDWFHNSRDLPRLFSQVSKRPSQDQAAAEEQARLYDTNHFANLTLQERYPRVFRAFRLFERLWRKSRIR